MCRVSSENADPSSRSSRARINEELTPEIQRAWALVCQGRGTVKSKRHLLAARAVIPLSLCKIVPCHDSVFKNIGGSSGQGRQSVLRDLTRSTLRTFKRLAAEIHVDNAAGLAQKRECRMGQMSGHGTTNFDSRFKAAGASCFVAGSHELFSINRLGTALFSLGRAPLSGTVAQNGRLRSALRPNVLENGTQKNSRYQMAFTHQEPSSKPSVCLRFPGRPCTPQISETHSDGSSQQPATGTLMPPMTAEGRLSPVNCMRFAGRHDAIPPFLS